MFLCSILSFSRLCQFACSVTCVCMIGNNHPEEFLRVFDEEGHAVVQFLQIVFQVTGCHLEQDRTEVRKTFTAALRKFFRSLYDGNNLT